MDSVNLNNSKETEGPAKLAKDKENGDRAHPQSETKEVLPPTSEDPVTLMPSRTTGTDSDNIPAKVQSENTPERKERKRPAVEEVGTSAKKSDKSSEASKKMGAVDESAKLNGDTNGDKGETKRPKVFPLGWMPPPMNAQDERCLTVLRSIRFKETRDIYSDKFQATFLEQTDEDFKRIQKYVEVGQHHGLKVKISTVLRVDIGAEDLTENLEGPLTYLWHGTSRTAISSILLEGLRMPNHGGQQFGPGLYFADRTTAAARFSKRQGQGNSGYLLLVAVSLGSSYKCSHSYLPSEFEIGNWDSVHVLGAEIPDPKEEVVDGKYVWPLGDTVKSGLEASQPHSEFVVFKQNKIKTKFLVKIEFV